MTDEEYNGWTNYDTWLVPLHVDNDRALNDQKAAILRAANKYEKKGKYNEAKLKKALLRLAKKGALTARKAGDQVNNKKVNWMEIVNNWVRDRKEYE